MVQPKTKKKAAPKTASVQAVEKLKKQLLLSRSGEKKAKQEINTLKTRLRKMELQHKQKQASFKRLLQETEIKASKKASEYAIKTFEKQNASRVKALQKVLVQTEKSWERECFKRLTAQMKPLKSKSSSPKTRAGSTKARTSPTSRAKTGSPSRVSALISEF